MNIEKIIKEKTAYSGTKKEGKILTASMVGAEDYQNYLRIKYGIEERESIDQTTIGTLLHLGLEKIFGKGKRIKANKGDWTLEGEYDAFIDNVLYDFKLTKSYTEKKIKENIENHPYTLQLNFYRYLLEKEGQKVKEMKLVLFFKDGGYDFRRDKNIPDFKEIKVPEINIEKIIEEKIKTLNEWLKDESKIERCKDLWFRGDKPIRCIKYCNFRKFCKFI